MNQSDPGGGREGGTAELLETRDGALVTLTMHNAGKLNAMSLELRDALSTTFARLNDEQVAFLKRHVPL